MDSRHHKCSRKTNDIKIRFKWAKEDKEENQWLEFDFDDFHFDDFHFDDSLFDDFRFDDFHFDDFHCYDFDIENKCTHVCALILVHSH